MSGTMQLKWGAYAPPRVLADAPVRQSSGVEKDGRIVALPWACPDRSAAACAGKSSTRGRVEQHPRRARLPKTTAHSRPVRMR